MNSMQEKFREERCAREKARLEKLRTMNLKKYKDDNVIPLPKASKSLMAQIPSKLNINVPPKPSTKPDDNTNKSDPKLRYTVSTDVLPKVDPKTQSRKTISGGSTDNTQKSIVPPKTSNASIPSTAKKFIFPPPKVTQTLNSKSGPTSARNSALPATRKSIAPPKSAPIPVRKSIVPVPVRKSIAPVPARKSIAPVPVRKSVVPSKNDNKESVFDRLYKPKIVAKKPTNVTEKGGNFIKPREKINQVLIPKIPNKRHTVFETKQTERLPVRRSISAVHFKRISKSELQNCVHKWASSENLNKRDLNNIEEAASMMQDRVMSAVKSERKRVQFKATFSNLNTPRPEELQSRLTNWLQKRGKSLASYHHLQCFGLHHQAQTEKEFQHYDEEDKENVALESDSDNDSFCENINDKCGNDYKWRRASCASGFDETQDTIESDEVRQNGDEVHNADELYLGALNDLTELVKEGYDWEQSARWLHVIRSRCPAVTASAIYWECRAMLAERKGDLPSSLTCWEEALANGSKSSVVEANLDQLLTKFMQLKISPSSVKKKPMTPKMVDVKNICRSSLLRFAVQEAKSRKSMQQAQYIVTPVRRSNRSTRNSSSKRPPLVQITSTLKSLGKDAQFVSNHTLPLTP